RNTRALCMSLGSGSIFPLILIAPSLLSASLLSASPLPPSPRPRVSPLRVSPPSSPRLLLVGRYNSRYNVAPVAQDGSTKQSRLAAARASTSAKADKPARPNMAQTPTARRGRDQEFCVRPALRREDKRRLPVAQTGDRSNRRRGN